MKKGDEVKDEDDDMVRTSVSQDRVIATLCTKELFLCTQYILLSPCTKQVKRGEGEDLDGQHDTLGGLIRLDILYNYFVTGDGNKAVFLFLAIQTLYRHV
jgi:hypothetical protein